MYKWEQLSEAFEKKCLLTEAKDDLEAFRNFVGDDDLVNRFNTLKDNQRIPYSKDKHYSDYYYWINNRSVNDLRTFVSDIEATPSAAEQRRILKEKGAEFIGETDGWKIYKIFTYEAARAYGKHTRWCITGVKNTDGSTYFSKYKNDGVKDYYFLIPKNDPEGKWCFLDWGTEDKFYKDSLFFNSADKGHNYTRIDDVNKYVPTSVINMLPRLENWEPYDSEKNVQLVYDDGKYKVSHATLMGMLKEFNDLYPGIDHRRSKQVTDFYVIDTDDAVWCYLNDYIPGESNPNETIIYAAERSRYSLVPDKCSYNTLAAVERFMPAEIIRMLPGLEGYVGYSDEENIETLYDENDWQVDLATLSAVAYYFPKAVSDSIFKDDKANYIISGRGTLLVWAIANGRTSVSSRLLDPYGKEYQIGIAATFPKAVRDILPNIQLLDFIEIDDKGTFVYHGEDGPLLGKDAVRRLVIANDCVKIKKETFRESAWLTSVEFEDPMASHCREIEWYAFAYCDGLTSITLPSSLEEIGTAAFLGCENLSKVTFSKPSKLRKIGFKAFGGICQNVPGEIIIPGSVTDILHNAFVGCAKLAVHFEEPSSLKEIYSNAFYEFTGMDTMVLPEGITAIHEGAFVGSPLKKIVLPSTLNEIGYCALNTNGGAKTIEIHGAYRPDMLKDSGIGLADRIEWVDAGKSQIGPTLKDDEDFDMDILLSESNNDRQAFINYAGADLAARFDKLKANGKIQPPFNDYYFWISHGRHVSELEKCIEEAEGTLSQNEERRLAKAGADEIYRGFGWTIYKINTYDAAKYYGEGTRWCISGRYSGEHQKGRTWFNYYKDSEGVKDYYFLLSDYSDKWCYLYMGKPLSEVGNERNDEDGHVHGKVFWSEGDVDRTPIEMAYQQYIPMIVLRHLPGAADYEPFSDKWQEEHEKDTLDIDDEDLYYDETWDDDWENDLEDDDLDEALKKMFSDRRYKGTDTGAVDESLFLSESKQDENNFIAYAGESLADRFNRIKNRVKGPKSDYYYWINNYPVDELEKFVGEIESTKTRSEAERAAKQGAELIYHDDGWRIYKINDYAAAAQYGRRTHWCIAATKAKDKESSGEYWFNYYMTRGGVQAFYYLIPDNGGDKWCYFYYGKNWSEVIDKAVFWDVDDVGYSFLEANECFLKEIPYDVIMQLPGTEGFNPVSKNTEDELDEWFSPIEELGKYLR